MKLMDFATEMFGEPALIRFYKVPEETVGNVMDYIEKPTDELKQDGVESLSDIMARYYLPENWLSQENRAKLLDIFKELRADRAVAYFVEGSTNITFYNVGEQLIYFLDFAGEVENSPFEKMTPSSIEWDKRENMEDYQITVCGDKQAMLRLYKTPYGRKDERDIFWQIDNGYMKELTEVPFTDFDKDVILRIVNRFKSKNFVVYLLSEDEKEQLNEFYGVVFEKKQLIFYKVKETVE